MDLENLINIFEQYGWSGLIGIGVVIGVYYLLKSNFEKSSDGMEKGFNKLTTTITKQNSELVKAITTSNEKTQERLFELVNRSLSDHSLRIEDTHNRSIDKRFDVSEEIGHHLWDLMNKYQAQRTIVIEFHNSKENLNGLSFLWYDVQYEKQQRDVQSISQKAKNLQASNLIPIINKVNKADGNIIHLSPEDIENIYDESTVLYSQFREINISNIIYCGLYNDENKLIGLLAIEYNSDHNFIPEIINYFDIKANAAAIAQLLQFKK